MSAKSNLSNPFPGLRSFRSDEDYLFFGREEQTMELLERLQRNRFVAVVGSSGGGKSSLVRCGLLSRLQGGGMVEAGAHWEIAVMHPGGNPLVQLADSLIEADLYDSEEEDVRPNLAATLGRSQFGLVEAVRHAKLPKGTNFLLVVDQFEEIFRFEEAGAAESEIANDFIGMLLEASAQTGMPIYVVTTMRSDFIGDCSRFEGLAEAVNRGEYLIPRLTREQFKSVIEGPIRVAGGRIAPRLLQRLLNDLGEEQDQLPCLQHALMRTWQVWSEREDAEAIDLEDYQRVGKMSQALSLHADEIYDGLANEKQRLLCAATFKALTVVGSEKRGIRRPRRLATLCQILSVEKAELLPILDAFRQAEVTFLLPPAEDELQDSTVIDLSHESLMRVWKRLRDWVDEEANSVGIFRRLSENAALFEQGKAGLYHDPELSVARNWVEQSHPNATWAAQYAGKFDEVMAYLERSREAAEEEQRAKEAALQHELEQAKALAEAQSQRAEEQARFSARLKWLVRGMGLVAAVAIVAMVIAIGARQEAQRNEARATENELLAVAEKQRADTQAEKFRHQVYKVQLLRADSALQQKNGGQAYAYLQECEPALREWEWRYMAHQADQSLDSYQAFEGEASQVKFSPDGKRLLTTSPQFLGFKVWDVASQELVWDTTRPFTGRPSFFIPAAYSGDGKLLAVRVEDSLEIWDVASRQKIQEIDNSTPFHRLAFDPNGQTIWTSRWGRLGGGSLGDQGAQQWDVATGQRKFALVMNDDRIHPPLLSPYGRTMVTTGYIDGSIQVWDTNKSSPVRMIEDRDGSNEEMVFSPDGKRLVVGTQNGALRVYDTSDWTEMELHEDRFSGDISTISFSPDGKLLAGAVDSSVIIWDGETFETLATLLGQSSKLRDLAFAPDGRTLASSDAMGNINFWSADQSGGGHSLLGHTNDLREIAYSPDGQRLVSSGFDGVLRVWEVATGREVLTLKGHGYWTDAVVYSPDGKQILSGGAHPDSTIRIWDSETGAHIRTLRGHTSGVFWVDYSPDGKLALSGDNAGVVKLWNVQTGEELHSISVSSSSIEGVKFSPDGRLFAILPRSGRGLSLWETTSGQLVKTFDLSSERFLRCVVFSPDGKSLAIGAVEPTVMIWNIETGESRTLVSTGGRVRSVVYSPDGKRLYAGGDRGRVVVWDVATGEQMLAIEGDPTTIWSVKVSPDGSTVASSGSDGVIRIWETERISGEFNRKRRLANAARVLVDERAKRHPFSADVIASLRADKALDPAVRDAAVELATIRGDIPLTLLQAGRETIKNREADADARALGLRQIETAVAQLPDNPEAYFTLGLAQIFVGKYAEALEAAERSNEIAREFYEVDSFLALMVQAMAHFRLGDKEKAKAIYAQAEAVPESSLDPRGGRGTVTQIAEEIIK